MDGIEEKLETKLVNDALCDRIILAQKAIDSETKSEDNNNFYDNGFIKKQRTVFFL